MGRAAQRWPGQVKSVLRQKSTRLSKVALAVVGAAAATAWSRANWKGVEVAPGASPVMTISAGTGHLSP